MQPKPTTLKSKTPRYLLMKLLILLLLAAGAGLTAGGAGPAGIASAGLPSTDSALAAPAPPAPPRTATPSRCGVCQLSVSSVSIVCNPDGSVGWTAAVYNRGSCPVTAGWNASLQVHLTSMPPGQFQTVAVQPGSSTFPAGVSTTVS